MKIDLGRKLTATITLSTLMLATTPTAVAGAGSLSAGAPVSATSFGALQPGRTVTLTQRVPINIVLLGFKPGQVDPKVLLRKVPASSKPAIRGWLKYGLTGRDVGLRYDYDFHVSNAGADVTNRFFAYLRASARLIHPTYYQQLYNDQVHNVLDITGPVLLDDGPSAEAWLEQNLQVPSKGYTLVFINWYGHPDFQFHLFGKSDAPDPDTGFNFGLTSTYGAFTAWGGSHGRLWFDDLSAGPDWNSISWDVDDPDLDGDGVIDYRMPPIWEYTKGGFRSPSALSSDLGLVTRYVGLDELFTSSPYYDPLATAPGVGGSKVLQVNMFEDDPASRGTDYLNRSTTRSALADLEPYYDWTTNVIDRDPIDPGALEAWRIEAGASDSNDCWNAYGTNQAELYCYFSANASAYFPSAGANDYIGNVVALNTTDAGFANLQWRGYADDTQIDGRQSIIEEVASTSARSVEGFTQTTIHESGHHFAGLGHPHDGFDPASGALLDPIDQYEFLWLGDASDTVMNYLHVSNSFGQFDKDNVYRWETAGYLNWANSLLGQMLGKPGAVKSLPAILRADVDAGKALDAFGRWDFLTAATDARTAYVEIQTVATRLGVTLPADKVSALAGPNLAVPTAPSGTLAVPRGTDSIQHPDPLGPSVDAGLQPIEPQP